MLRRVCPFQYSTRSRSSSFSCRSRAVSTISEPVWMEYRMSGSLRSKAPVFSVALLICSGIISREEIENFPLLSGSFCVTVLSIERMPSPTEAEYAP